MPRDALVERLASTLPDGVVEHGVRIASVEVDHGRAVVTDATGAVHRPDVVVGADGVRSTVRAACPGLPGARGAGWATWQGMTGVLPGLASGRSGRYVVGGAGFVGAMPAGDGLVLWWFDVPHPTGDERPSRVADWLRERFRSYGSFVPELLAAVHDGDLDLYPHAHLPVTDAWGRGPLTLLGDAAHAFPPTQAQGANQALEDAWSLAAALDGCESDGAGAALRRHERARARRVRRVSRMAATEMAERPPNAAVRALARAVPDAVAARGYAALLRSFSSVLHDERA